ncbi:hypothetical protein [Acanthamoeba polyphaga mimivirus]|uniref:Papain-like cysteine peptidase n=1 Tax=Acanthamoeba polyphaga mimivirus TaxID=212035 RepID=A0A2L2DKB6_MIMIV|nr:hypothetical protein [Acanthamoeba polyphaga mimivirus]
MSTKICAENNNLEIISLGSNCATKFSIRAFHSQQPTYPFDWIISNDLDDIIKFINNEDYSKFIDFANYKKCLLNYSKNYTEDEKKLFNSMNHNDLIDLVIKCNGEIFSPDTILLGLKKNIIDTLNRIKININIDDTTNKFFTGLVIGMVYSKTRLLHDHHINISWNEVKDKYCRRFERFIELKKIDKTILFVRYVSDMNDNIDELIKCLDNNFSKYYLLLIYHDPNGSENVDKFISVTDRCFNCTAKLISSRHPYYRNILRKFINEIINK